MRDAISGLPGEEEADRRPALGGQAFGLQAEGGFGRTGDHRTQVALVDAISCHHETNDRFV